MHNNSGDDSSNVRCGNQSNVKKYSNQNLKNKGHREFLVVHFVEYCRDTDISKCLIKKCERLMSGRRASNIKRHYHRVHNFVIVHDNSTAYEEYEKNTTVVSFDNYAMYDTEISGYQCLFLNCNKILEKDVTILKKHYYEMHSIIIANNAENIQNHVYRKRKHHNIDESNKDNKFSARDEECVSVSDSCSTKDGSLSDPERSHGSMKKLKEREFRKFPANMYVEYCGSTNISKCLIRNCTRLMSGLMSSNIKRHYRTIHNMVVMYGIGSRNAESNEYHALQESIELNNFVLHDVNNSSYNCLFVNCTYNLEINLNVIKSHYLEIHNITIEGNSKSSSLSKKHKKNQMDINETLINQNVKSHNKNKISNSIFNNYIQYNKIGDISKCVIRNCQKSMRNGSVRSIKSHYRSEHNINIGLETSAEEDEESFGESEEETNIEINNLVIYDKGTCSYQCLFIGCNQILEKNFTTIKKHYREKHKANITAKSDYIIYRRRRYNKLHYSNESDNSDDNFSIRNEFLSEGEQTSPCNTLTDYMDDIDLCSIKMEFTSAKEEVYIPSKYDNFTTSNENITFPLNLAEKPKNLKITSTKQTFLKLCLDLVIQRDLSLNLFNNNLHFKPLFLPYEQLFDCHINSGLMLNLALNVYNIIIGDLKNILHNKIVNLELHVVKWKKRTYLSLSVRYVDKENVFNKIIGCLPITTTETGVLPIFEHLRKFNIDKQQIYMITLSFGLLDDAEVDTICDNICKHNPNIHKHPLFYIKKILKSFVQEFSNDIQIWQKMLNYDCNLNMDIFNNFKTLASCMKNSLESNTELTPQLREANLFLKILQIINNFVEKLSKEQYVVGDFYRDWLCCELELKAEETKNNNSYGGKLFENFMECKTSLLESNEFIAALYLDARFNFMGSSLLSDAQKTTGKQFLYSIWQQFQKYIQPSANSVDLLIEMDSTNDATDDQYALLDQHINNTMTVKHSVCILDMLANYISTKREPFSVDILKYWHSKGKDMNDINQLTKIVFTMSASQHMSLHLQNNFAVFHEDTDKFDKFLITNNQDIVDKNIDLIFKDFI